MPTDKLQGEGDYEAARDHDDAQREFAESGQVQKAARDAAPTSRAEADGKSHSKGGFPGEKEEASGPTGTAQPPKGN